MVNEPHSAALSKAVVIGASGFIGGQLLRRLRRRGVATEGTFLSTPAAGLRPLDYRDAGALKGLLEAAAPEVVFCPAAQPDVDWCEAHPEESYRRNVAGAQNVAAACAALGVPAVYFSSDYVFDGASGPYGEEDEPNPINVYGRHKLAAETALRSLLPAKHIVVRTTVVYGWERQGKNYVARLIRGLRAGRACHAPEDQIGTPTYGPNLAEAAIELAERRLFGTWHIVGPERMSRYEFACRVATTFGLDRGLIQPVTTIELRQRAARPLQAGLLADKAVAVLRTRLLGATGGLQRMRAEESAADSSGKGMIG